MIEDCESCLNKIKQYDPDPYYVNHFLEKYIDSINNTYREVLDEGNRDFGLFLSENISKEEFYKKAIIKDDQNAIKFAEWYLATYSDEHKKTYPKIITKISQLKKNKETFKIKIKIRALDRYDNDVHLEINPGLNQGKLRSKEELEIQTKRQLPLFLEIINHKRKQNQEPGVQAKQTRVSAFIEIDGYEDIEIAYITEIYISVIRRIVEETRGKIKELTSWKIN